MHLHNSIRQLSFRVRRTPQQYGGSGQTGHERHCSPAANFRPRATNHQVRQQWSVWGSSWARAQSIVAHVVVGCSWILSQKQYSFPFMFCNPHELVGYKRTHVTVSDSINRTTCTIGFANYHVGTRQQQTLVEKSTKNVFLKIHSQRLD